MPARIALFSDAEGDQPLDTVQLGEILAPEVFSDAFEGQDIRLYGRNTGDTYMRDVSVHLSGEGRFNIQLSRDADGNPGVWAAAGESIKVVDDNLGVDEGFSFWIRGVYNPTDAEKRMVFSLVLKGVSVGI